MGGGGGNIDLGNRPRVYNPDGSVSTELSFSREDDGKEVLVPQIVNGKLLSQDEAWRHYKRTGEHLGKFDSVEEANAYAQKIHERADTSVDPNRRVLLNQQQVLIPDTGAAQYWYVDPRARDYTDDEKELIRAKGGKTKEELRAEYEHNLMEALSRLGVPSQPQPIGF